jgi:trehalose 6-phosphate phosphatase
LLDTVSRLEVQDFFRDLSQAGQSALLLDYDGTLAPFQQDRYKAYPYPGVTALLREIMDTRRTRLVLISGRRAHELLSLLDLTPHPEIWGTHGLERLGPDGSYRSPQMDSYTADALAAADQWVDTLQLHHLAEHKPGSLAVHWRGLSEEKANEVRSKVLLGWLSIADRACLALEHFDGGVEIRMSDRNKGDAVRAILAEVDPDSPVAYLGDDQSDEDAFRALQDRGLSVLVRPQWRDSAANLWLRSPIQLIAFLHQWLEACRGKAPDRRRRLRATSSRASSQNQRTEDTQHPER